MFTGFASENTPAIQVWDFSTTTKNVIQIALTDDCAPIQVIVGGATDNTVSLYLPSSPIEGKQIKIINTLYGSTTAPIFIRSSDISGLGASNVLAALTTGQTLDLCYSKNFISRSSSAVKTGWIALNQAPFSASNRNAISFGNGNTASGSASGTFGGSSNIASNSDSSVVGGSSNTASGTNAAVIGGEGNSASGLQSFVSSGNNNAANNSYSSVFGGAFNTASGIYSLILGGVASTANAQASSVLGGYRGTTRGIVGNVASPASLSPVTTTVGVSQSALLVLGRQTTDATATRLTSDQNATSTTNQVILPNNSAYTFQGTCIANVTAGGTTSGWKFEGVIKRGANAASTTLVAAVTPTVIAQDAGAAAWVLAVTADTTNGGIAVTVTGAAATTIRWVAKIETTEVTF